MDGIWGLHGWQWMFIIEAIPAVILGVVVLFYLTDRPEKANWLTTEERDWLVKIMDQERAGKAKASHSISGRVLQTAACWHWRWFTSARPLVFIARHLGATDHSRLWPLANRDRPDSLGTPFRPHWGAHMARCRCLPFACGWPCLRKRRNDDICGACSIDAGEHRHQCLQTATLEHANAVPFRSCRCRRYRNDQLHRQSRRFCRSVNDWLDKGHHWKLRGWPLLRRCIVGRFSHRHPNSCPWRVNTAIRCKAIRSTLIY